jgi:hypothetical protein
MYIFIILKRNMKLTAVFIYFLFMIQNFFDFLKSATYKKYFKSTKLTLIFTHFLLCALFTFMLNTKKLREKFLTFR